MCAVWAREREFVCSDDVKSEWQQLFFGLAMLLEGRWRLDAS